MKYSIVVTLLLACCTQLLSAQPQELTKYEYAVLAFGALAKTENVPRRVKRVYIYQNNAEVGDVISETIEYEPRTHEHSITLRKTSKATIREESIHADGRDFVRKGAGKWKERKDTYAIPTLTGTGSATSGSGVSTDQQLTEVFRRIGFEMIDGQEIQIIESVKTSVEKRGSSTMTAQFFERLWIQKGRIKKEELRSTQDGVVYSHTVSEYEYDPNIRIEVPIRR
jgi:hypothetical protein